MKQAQFEWGRGTVQKQQTEQAIQKLQSMAEVHLCGNYRKLSLLTLLCWLVAGTICSHH